jgi:hypothetical protein
MNENDEEQPLEYGEEEKKEDDNYLHLFKASGV